MSKRILIVEDELPIAELEKDYLELSGFEVVICSDGTEGMKMATTEKFDMVILDLMLPGTDGFEICKKIRETSEIPIMMVSAKKEDIDKIRGLGLGANDYIRKPFQILELVVRIKALLKRNRQGVAEDSNLTLCDCSLDFASQHLAVGDDTFELSHTEAVIIDELFRHPNEVVEARTLMYRIWQNDDYNNLNRLHGFIYKLRKYLSKSTGLELLNVRGIGYKLAVNPASLNKAPPAD